ncbi:hypothetical protein BDW02DRAFT_43845 [Decorospora gaudefroyi]|uniref:Uncharacterized protein n=1 Tax=Decorospora gaudefroyi TaxID=184978 RepID=A0A6A5KAW8_9PLEO|nr:hypothetical protein BDW02DRAFT_43845 [Decorospora gaudefroyi]
MAAYQPDSQSPRVSDRTSPRIHAGNPMTPVHSPHHSVTSSVSSRTPVHTLTIHEYRKQQHTPSSLSQKGTPSGKTLRRKPAASALHDIERVASTSPPTRLRSASSLRPLHFSQSAHQLKPSPPPVQQETLLELAFRSQSAEPRVQTGSISSISTSSSGKVRYFNSRKRLPKPPAATGPVLFPPLLANVNCARSRRRSPPPAALSFSTERSHSSGAQTTPSTFSLSRFPQPPHRTEPSLSPPGDERERTCINALSFSTTAPATPPATPAIIHYRGASFDLVNPHDSLLLHDIVTPSRDFDSSDYLPLRSSEEPFSEMAPKRAVYGDFHAAHAGILRRPEDSFDESNADLPLPPTPAAVSPNSPSYASPTYSPESVNAPSPLVVKKQTNESRFSLKELTRSLTKKLAKSPAKTQGEELQDMPNHSVSMASASMEGVYPRPLTRTYVTTPEASYFPIGPMSPATPTSPTSPEGLDAFSPGQNEVEFPRRHTEDRYQVEPLASMVPDDPSTQVGRQDESQPRFLEEGGFSKPYYDDLDSIYPSSSVYTGDGRRKSNYQQSFSSNRNSSGNPFARYSGMDANSFANEYNRDSLYGRSSSSRVSRQLSRPFTQDMYHRTVDNVDPKTDTISKLIDEYNPHDTADTNLPTCHEEAADTHGVNATSFEALQEQSIAERPQQTKATSDFGHFQFGLGQNAQQRPNLVSPVQCMPASRPTIGQHPGCPPREAGPLAPAFEYDEEPFIPPRPGMSGMFSNNSYYSYGDTRNLLQISHSDVTAQPVAAQTLEPSSSYSQPEAKPLEPSSSYSQPDGPHSPQTPKEALDQAEQIFQDTVDKHRSDSKIPAMWARCNSGSQLLSKTVANRLSGASGPPMGGGEGANPEEKADWETVGGNSRDSRGHESLDSIADYSSSEGTRNSLGLNSDGSLPSWAKQTQSPGRSSYYSHPSPIRTQHAHPFSSSPPELKGRASVRTAPDTSSPPLVVSSRASRTTPMFSFSTHPEDVIGRGAVEQPYAFTPWADPYAFSDKETQELLASGPNDNIIVDNEPAASSRRTRTHTQSGSPYALHTSSSPNQSAFRSSPVGLQRENTFEKLCVVGPKGNLTGTPRGTGMHETGSSVADTSSPGVRLSSSVGRQSFRADYNGFYASPFPATGSVTRISQSRPPFNTEHERIPSKTTLFPNKSLEPVQNPPLPGGRKHLRNSTTFLHGQRRTSRSAVPGQTKLRHMFLAPEDRSNNSTRGTHISHFMGGSDRPSTSDTNTPLRSSHVSIGTYPASIRPTIAHQYSPHLLCVEREANPEDEARRRRLSWFIFAAFCVLPPCIILFRFLGDNIIASLTKGHLGHCTPQSKRTALIAGIAVNVGLVTAILVPVLVAHALKVV